MYCVREKDKWYCIDDDIYQRISKKIDGYVSENINTFKENGIPYVLNKEGLYEEADDE